MAAPLNKGKQSVDLAAPGSRVSRIRRDPPPARSVKLSIAERDELNQRVVVIGVLAFALALVIIIVGVSTALGWSPSEHEVHLEL